LPKDVVAWVGQYFLERENERGSIAYDVDNFIVHEDWKYDEDNYDADIALILLARKVNLDQRKFVDLPAPSQGEVTVDGTVVSFGHLTDGDSTPNELTIPAVTQAQCFEADYRLRELSSNRTFCAGFVNQGKSVCKGDTGGGFYQLDRSTERHTLAGIVSASLSGGCNINTYSVFTDVSKFTEWIQEKMEEIEWTYVEFTDDL
jgi:secreted trypsin-like serine protease